MIEIWNINVFIKLYHVERLSRWLVRLALVTLTSFYKLWYCINAKDRKSVTIKSTGESSDKQDKLLNDYE